MQHPTLRNANRSSSSSILILLLLLATNIRTTVALIKLPPNVTVPAVLVFGDSMVDTGNNNYIPTLVNCNFPPYGLGFKGGFPTGRFSDGKVPSDLVAEELGIKDTVPAYLDPAVLPEDLLTGVTFASGGSGYDPLTPLLVKVISLEDQLNYLKEYKGKVKKLVGEERGNFIIANSLYLVVAGSDDIANTYYTLRARKLQYNVHRYSDHMANSASAFVQNLYNLGARRIGVLGAPPIGCMPAQRKAAGGIRRNCAENQNLAATLFNYKLSKILASFNTKLPKSKIVYIDVYNTFLDLIQNPKQYGFEIADRGCCGIGDSDTGILCNRRTRIICGNVSNYVFWDSYHPTEKVYRILTSQFVNNYVNKLF